MTKGKVVVFSFAFDAKPENRRSLRYTPPDFLWRLVASANFMRLSLRKDAHAAVSSAAWQEIRVRSGRDDNSFLTLTFPIINLCGVHSTSTFRSSQAAWMTKGKVALSLAFDARPENSRSQADEFSRRLWSPRVFRTFTASSC